ncbi:cell division protein FtsQ/DivIB [Aquabacterium sp. J223]|uniref:cell division protein FtsQ/DivIB n=1 Tax=Aquabacterium sp. J223 TaxID=2898431 RepID=UPI0021ADC6F4|nr:cell division protein FtsQ/DivIB [Aquabacterium sp. J223]UUX95661.1 cell division protein FtsQ/DivIB [Aquabacterium sp. J223]
MNAAVLANPLPADVRLTRALASTLFVVVGLGVVAAGLLALARLPVFTIRSIQIEGEVSRNTAATIRTHALPALRGNFFTLDLRRGREAFQRVPWVRRAVVRRVWPNGLKVSLEEHHPAALWRGLRDGEEDRLVNREGEVFEANVGDVEEDRLPQLAGPDGSSSKVLALYQRLVPVFDRLDMGLERLSLTDRGSWQADLDTGAKVELGRGEPQEVLARAERFARTLPQVTARFQRPLATADLRHADGYAVKLKGITTTMEATPAKPGAPKTRTR